MAGKYITRAMEPVLERAAGEFPAVVLTGPRQSGKTTLLKKLFGMHAGYASLDLPDVAAAAVVDPRGFLDAYPPPVIFDEVQHAPGLLPYVRERIDADRGRKGRYFLTGSQNLLLLEKISETLAGRAAMLRLLPLSHREIRGFGDVPMPWEKRDGAVEAGKIRSKDLWKAVLRGNYPEPVSEPGRDVALWHSSYLQTYIERDVRTLRQVGDLVSFQAFLRMLAARSGQLLNLAGLARELGVASNTAKAWISMLEASFQVTIVRPYWANIGKRLVKAPKVYFTDTGLLCHLTGLRDSEHAASGPMAGAIFETAVLSEIMKTHFSRGEIPEVYFWRTAAGREVDFIVEAKGKLIPVEVKLSSTPNPAMAEGIASFREDLKGKAGPGFVVHPGSIRLPLVPGATAIPFWDL